MKFFGGNQTTETGLNAGKIPDAYNRYRLRSSHVAQVNHVKLPEGNILSQCVKGDEYEFWKHDLFIEKPGFIYPYSDKLITALHFMVQGSVKGWFSPIDTLKMTDRDFLLVVIPPEYPLRILMRPGHYISCHINFEPALLGKWARLDNTILEMLSRAQQEHPVASYYQPAKFGYVESSILDEMLECKADPLEHHYLIMSRTFELLRHYNGQLKNNNHLVSIPKSRIRKLLEIKNEILANLNQPLSVKALARKYSISVTTLRKSFREHFKQQIKDFHKDHSMKNAMRMLKQSKYKISDIAQQVGYQDGSSFTRAFTQYFGKPPNHIRHQAG